MFSTSFKKQVSHIKNNPESQLFITFLADCPHRFTTVVLSRLVSIQGFLMFIRFKDIK